MKKTAKKLMPIPKGYVVLTRESTSGSLQDINITMMKILKIKALYNMLCIT